MIEQSFLKRHHVNLLTVIIILVVITQVITTYVVVTRVGNLETNLKNTASQWNNNLGNLEKDLQGKMNTLTDTITSISSVQTDLKEQVSEIKATTSSDFSAIIEEEISGVVTIKTDVSQGTGFLISDDGFIATNYHVVQGAKSAAVVTSDLKQHSVSLVGADPNKDVALLKIQGSYNSLELGNSDDAKIGEKVIAIGNPLGLSFTATEGIISARDREGINNLPYYFQTDVALNPGNSGGPLINTKGEVIGINNFKVSGAESIGFALEINYARETINDISQKALNETIV